MNLTEAKDHLLPCPFCNTQPEWVNQALADSHFYIKCPHCQFTMKQDRKDKVIGFWNRREAAELYARSAAEQSLKEIEELKSKNFASERLRMEDAFSAINEANQLREKIKEQELIIYGIEEGSGQWQSLCADKEREITELKANINYMAAQAWEEACKAVELEAECLGTDYITPINPYKP